MATTGVPNQLYQGTDAPDLVGGAFATHTHEVSIETVKGSASGSVTTEGRSSGIDVSVSIPQGKTLIGVLSVYTTNWNTGVVGYKLKSTTDNLASFVVYVRPNATGVLSAEVNIEAVFI